jgi:PPOX class probable F420-dependent enzyme
MSVRIRGWARELLERPGAFGTLATLERNGSPLQAVVWFELRGDDVLVNSAVGRRWPTNLLRDPRCGLVVEQGYEWVGIRGQAEALHDPVEAQSDIAAMARRYHADDPERAERLIRQGFQRQERISFLLHPESITEHPDA